MDYGDIVQVMDYYDKSDKLIGKRNDNLKKEIRIIQLLLQRYIMTNFSKLSTNIKTLYRYDEIIVDGPLWPKTETEVINERYKDLFIINRPNIDLIPDELKPNIEPMSDDIRMWADEDKGCILTIDKSGNFECGIFCKKYILGSYGKNRYAQCLESKPLSIEQVFELMPYDELEAKLRQELIGKGILVENPEERMKDEIEREEKLGHTLKSLSNAY